MVRERFIILSSARLFRVRSLPVLVFMEYGNLLPVRECVRISAVFLLISRDLLFLIGGLDPTTSSELKLLSAVSVTLRGVLRSITFREIVIF